jgi:diaminopimelate epimerase
MTVKFIKAQGAGNDFLFTWEQDAPPDDRAALARAICDRHTGIGADGWYALGPAGAGWDASIDLFNSDGSKAELSGNGTRCAAAILIEAGLAGERPRILTGAGVRSLRLIERDGRRFLLEMNMGRPAVPTGGLRARLALAAGPVEVTIVDAGNPQCAVFVDGFPPDWARTAAEIESHPHFPRRTNVSLVRLLDRHTVEARFFERGAGVTLSSGTGSTGAAVAAIARGAAESPVRVITMAGDLELRWEDEAFLTGPAWIVARGEFYWEGRKRAE